MDEAYGGMQVSPLRLKGDQCHGITLSGQRCKKRACCDSYYCDRHEHLYKLERPEECSICMEKLSETDRPISCGHYMHKDCLKRWLRDNKRCPMCRTVMREVSLTYEATLDLLELLRDCCRPQQPTTDLQV